MKALTLKLAVVGLFSLTLSGCVVAPSQPLGYRMTSSVLPTYVNGQYVGMQPSDYIAPAQSAGTAAPTASANYQAAPAQSVQQAQPTQPAPVYLQSTTPSVVYVQAPTPVYAAPYYAPGYYPYAYPCCGPYWGNPWFGGIGVGIGFRFRVH